MTSVPVTSDGMRSGVNWMREKVRCSARDNVEMSSVLASPGTPTSRQFPPANRAMSDCSTMSSLPTITLRSSLPMRRPASVRRSASSASSSRSSSAVLGAAVAVKRASSWSAGEGVHQVVHAKLVGFIGRIDGIEPFVRPFPVLGDVVVVVDDRHQALIAIVVLVQPPELGRHPPVRMREVQVRDAIERIEDLVVDRQAHRVQLREGARELLGEVHPVVSREVVEDDEPALEQIIA